MKNFIDFYQEAYGRLQKWEEREWNDGGVENPLLLEAMAKLKELNVGGKRLRGTLVYIGYHLVNDGDISEADALAQAYEMFQTAILVHDDVFDHAECRRDHRTLHTQYYQKFRKRDALAEEESAAADIGNSTAICLGDFGMYRAEQLLVNAYQNRSDLGRILSYYHSMIQKTIEGEILDLQLPYIEKFSLWDEFNIAKDTLEKMIKEIYHLKTSCYTMIGPVCSGMLLGGASDSLLEKMEAVADDLGIAFQLQDDVLGIYGENIGKDIGSDISEFKQTLLYSYVRAEEGRDYQKLMKYYGKENLTQDEIHCVRELLKDSGALAYVEKLIAKYYKRASDHLEHIEEISAEKRYLLQDFILYLSQRKI